MWTDWERNRWISISDLKGMRAEGNVEGLLAGMHQLDQEVREAAAKMVELADLSRMNQENNEAGLVTVLLFCNQELRQAAAQMLASMGRAALRRMIMIRSTENLADETLRAIDEALTQQGCSEAVSVIVTILSESLKS